MSRRNGERGFTLIELMFAMSFVSVLLILILVTTLQVTRIYNKGITLKQVNQSGASVAGELQISLKAASAPLTLGSLHNGDGSGGRLCLGRYSYVWNLKGATTNRLSGSDTPLGLVKVADPTSAMCDGTPDVPADRATELLRGSDATGVTLELRDFDVKKLASTGTDYVYGVTFTVSTDDESLIENDRCSGKASDEFCALNSFGFDVFVRQGGNG